MRLLVTRPAEDAHRTEARLRALGHDVRLGPLLKIEAIPGADLGAPPWHAILLTSANAARAAATHPGVAELRALPVLAVGSRTAEAARSAGFADVHSADGSAEDLARLAAARLGAGARLLYLAGTERARDMAAELAPLGIEVAIVEVYRAEVEPAFPAGVEVALRAGEIDGVLHFSARTAETFLHCAERASLLRAALEPIQFCISAAVGARFTAAGAERVRIAERPDEEALVALIGPA